MGVIAMSSGRSFVWRGILNPSLLDDYIVARSHAFADAAKAGEWGTVLKMLDNPAIDVNWWRPGGTAWYTALHQAAWHNAPVNVVAKLIRRGALLTLTEANGRTAYEVLMDRQRDGHLGTAVGVKQRTLLARLLKPSVSPLAADHIRALESHLADVIDGRIRDALFDGRKPREQLRYPPVGILHEIPDQHLWFPVPGMYGGFDIRLCGDVLDVKSWCRVVGGSGQHHVITGAGAILIDEGFV
jgi:hypothetical protein